MPRVKATFSCQLFLAHYTHYPHYCCGCCVFLGVGSHPRHATVVQRTKAGRSPWDKVHRESRYRLRCAALRSSLRGQKSFVSPAEGFCTYAWISWTLGTCLSVPRIAQDTTPTPRLHRGSPFLLRYPAFFHVPMAFTVSSAVAPALSSQAPAHSSDSAAHIAALTARVARVWSEPSLWEGGGAKLASA